MKINCEKYISALLSISTNVIVTLEYFRTMGSLTISIMTHCFKDFLCQTGVLICAGVIFCQAGVFFAGLIFSQSWIDCPGLPFNFVMLRMKDAHV